MVKNRIFFYAVFSVLCLVPYNVLLCDEESDGNTVRIAYHDTDSASMTLHTLYGSIDVDDPLIIDLISSPQMQRLKHVRQYGVAFYAVNADDFTRFDHSVGVFHLTKLFGGSRTEQVAALLHDISHGVFSHTTGLIYHDDAVKADNHQDDIHAWYLDQCGIASILEHHGFSLADVHHKQSAFTVLEQELPDLCADRLEYNLQGGYREGLFSQEQIQQILDDIVCDNGQWFFRHKHIARLFAGCSLEMTEHVWGSARHKIAEYWLVLALRHALQHNIISDDDIHFSTDDIVWNTLKNTDDEMIQECLDLIENHSACYMTISPHSIDRVYRGKFRGIDPLVATENGRQLLTTIDEDYHAEFYKVKELMATGWPVKFQCKQ